MLGIGLPIEINPDKKQAPHYLARDGFVGELRVNKVVITEMGTVENLPIVDFVVQTTNGEKYLMVLTGRLVNAISAAVRGTNLRNHGREEP